MRLINFKLRYPQGVELVGLGHNWDLHNFSTFVGARYDATSATAVLTWTADSVGNPWGDPSNLSPACSLRFDGVTRWEVDGGKGQDGDILAEISDRPQGADNCYEHEQFDMWIRFEDETTIKVAAESSTLIAEVSGGPNQPMQLRR